MKYSLKNGKTVIIREPQVKDAEGIISVMTKVDTETLFLARNPGEFCTTVEKEKRIIDSVLNNPNCTWFIAEYTGRIVGQCSVGLVRGYQRYRHRAEVAFVILKDFCNIGIGGKMMLECLKWCTDNNVSQVELDVVTTNERALAMYKSFGFEVVGTLPNALRYPDGTYADEYKMVKILK
ncbi:MAG: GNAT family N-acetyltransferase [Lachnospiraceae bacterium]|nr:GNAT family N-acetyltransferase [Lachnospiraceae bacterium]